MALAIISRPARQPEARVTLMPSTEAQGHQVGHHRLLRHPDRLGEGDPRRVQRRRRRGTASASTRSRSSHRFFEIQAEIIRGSYELYAEVLRRATVRAAKEIGWEIEPSRAQFLPDSVARWLPFREANAAMDRLAKRYDVGIVSNIDDKLLGVSRRHLRTELDLVVTAQQVRSYKPDPAHFKECARRIGGKKGWVHIASGYETDVAPVLKMNVPGDLGQPQAARSSTGASRQPRRSRTSARRPRGLAPADVVPRDPADEAMVARAHERFAAERRRARRRRPAGAARALPNLLVIGGLKCGTTSLHHYLNLHPEIEMSRPKELNFFVAELNWPLGADWYARPLRRRRAGPRRELSALHQPASVRRASPSGCARCSATPRLVYMVRDPIDRMLSHYLHNVGGGYEHRALADALRRPARAPTWTAAATPSSSSPISRPFGAERIEVVSPRGAEARAPGDDAARLRLPGRRPRASPRSSSSASGRPGPRRAATGSGSWTGPSASRACGPSTATSTACPSRCAGWSSGSSTTPTPARCRSPSSRRRSASSSASLFRDDVARLEEIAGPQLRLARRSGAARELAGDAPKLWHARVGAADERVGIAEAIVEELRRRGHEPIAARRAQRRRARRLGLGERGRRPGRRRGPRRAGDRLLLDRHRRLDRRQQGAGRPGRPLRRRRRPPPARAGGTTPTCSRSACAPPPRPSSARSSTPGSRPSPAPTTDDRANVGPPVRDRAEQPYSLRADAPPASRPGPDQRRRAARRARAGRPSSRSTVRT